MNEDTYVACHAPSLALLLYENVCCTVDQKGLLLGTVETQVTTSNTDEREADEKEKTVIYIEHCVPIDETEMFDQYGEVSGNFAETYLGNYGKKIIGWYSYRRNSPMKCSMKEEIMHRSLLNAISTATPAKFTLALLSSNVNSSGSTHSFNQSFHRLNGRNSFERLRLKIYSLSDKATNSSGYQLHKSFPQSTAFNHILLKVSSEKANEENCIRSLEFIQKEVIENLSAASLKVIECEERRAYLQSSVDDLRERLQLKPSLPVIAETPPVHSTPEFVPRLVNYDVRQDYCRGRQGPLYGLFDDDLSEEENTTQNDSKENEKVDRPGNEGSTLTSDGDSASVSNASLVKSGFSYASATLGKPKEAQSPPRQSDGTGDPSNAMDVEY